MIFLTIYNKRKRIDYYEKKTKWRRCLTLDV